MSRACVMVIGNEILDGSTIETNGGWICRQLSGRGATVVATVVVPDDQDEIADGLAFLIKKQPRLIVTMGGLGPTRDDLTLQAIARFMGIETAVNEEALAIVRRRYQELAAEGRIADADTADAVAAREKMARLPDGGHPLDNRVGAGPAVWLPLGEAAILALPGVPREVQSIFTSSCSEILRSTIGTGCFRTATLVLSTNDESCLAGPLLAFDAAYAGSGVYVKSRARRFASQERMTVTISAKGDEDADVLRRLDEAREGFTQILRQASIAVLSEERGE